MFGFLLIIIGVLFLLRDLGLLIGLTWGIIWPVLLIILGIVLLERRQWRRRQWKKWMSGDMDEE